MRPMTRLTLGQDRLRGVSRPEGFTSSLSQNRARDSRLTRLPSGKLAAIAESPMHKGPAVFTRDLLQEETRAS